MYATITSNLNYIYIICVCVCVYVLIFSQYRVSLTNFTGSASTIFAFMVKVASNIFIIFIHFIFISSMFITGSWFDFTVHYQ